MKRVTFFNTCEELCKLTGLPDDDALWDAGFNLDDWDWGFVAETKWTDDWDDDHPYYEFWMLTRMDDHCAGYEHTEYNGKHYYILYHS